MGRLAVGFGVAVILVGVVGYAATGGHEGRRPGAP